MKQDYNTLKDNLSLNPDVNPVFAVKIEDFDLRIHTSIEEGSDNAVFASIWSYSPGKYILSETLEGQAVLETIKEQLNDVLDVTKKQLDKMNKEDNIVFEVEAIGSADAIPYRRKVYYDGLLGDTLYNVRYYRFNEPDNPLYITFIKNETLMSNEYLALLRAYDAVKSLCHGYYIDNVKIFTREFDKTGPEYRRLDLQITLRNAFLEDYNELSFGSRLFKKIFK
jgi:hypothetical protein